MVIADETGIPANTIMGWSVRYGWQDLMRNTHEFIARRGVQAFKNDNVLRGQLREEAKAQVDTMRKNPIRGLGELRNTPEREGRTSLLCRMVSAVKDIDDWGAASKPGLILGELLSNEAVDVESTVNTGDCAQVGEGDGSVQGESSEAGYGSVQ